MQLPVRELDSDCCVQEKVCGEGNYTYFAGAFDWKDTAAGSLNMDIYENDLDVLEGDAIGAFKRISKPIERATL